MFSGFSLDPFAPRRIGLAICSFNLATPTAMSCRAQSPGLQLTLTNNFWTRPFGKISRSGRQTPRAACLLADVAWRWSLPEPGVALEALRSEVTVEELHDELRQHGALAGSTAECYRTFRCGLNPKFGCHIIRNWLVITMLIYPQINQFLSTYQGQEWYNYPFVPDVSNPSAVKKKRDTMAFGGSPPAPVSRLL